MIQEATSGKKPWSADLLADSKSQKVAGIVWAAKKLVSEELFFYFDFNFINYSHN